MLPGSKITPTVFPGQRGYSLLELAASVILLAGIAVLSLPTYQDFAPHDTAELVQVVPAPVGQKHPEAPAAGSKIQDQPDAHPAKGKEGKDLVESPEEPNDD